MYNIKIAQELKLKPQQVEATIKLLDEGSTIPFISRYRKEITDNLDETVITSIRDRVEALRELDKRKAAILESVEKQGKLTDELKAKLLAAATMTVLEDLYLPYKPKRRTKATIAKEKGLEPLAQIIFEQTGVDPKKEAEKYISAEKEVKSVDEALEGSRHIIAEWINENEEARKQLRKLYADTGVMTSKIIKGKEEEGQNYKDYFDWKELARTAPSHRILAVRRGENEKLLTSRIEVEEQEALKILQKLFVKGKNADSSQVMMACDDSFTRLLSLSMESELRMELKKRADLEAIDIFNKNLRQLLMASPMGQKRVMGIDPGQRTGCKIVCLDEQGKLLDNDVIYLIKSERELEEAADIVLRLFKKYKIEVIAIGNGTASRETEAFVKRLPFPIKPVIVLVSESGASIYSASEVAREEFPDQDVTVRGSVSIARRLMDPLAELVKIDPKSIGVGQYQHDVDQKLLRQNLDDTVVSCVNNVGVEVNTASKQLLTYVSGLGPARAQAIIEQRNKKGKFKSRVELSKTPGLTAKAFEQAIGFLRIHDAENPLDASAVHPEAYPIVEKMAKDLDCSVKDLVDSSELRKKIELSKYVTDKIGMPTLVDIKNELEKPGRDPREAFELFSFKEGVETLDDLKPGMELPGVVTNITAFGAFVDIGVHHDGLVHISEMADRYVKDPNQVVHVHQKVNVRVVEIDQKRKRIALSMKKKLQ
ncbi:MAG: RNA-binding transcriptional accessory protein [Candidatus Omnitrophica bacterium]|nr:RNA-binding transcriptional accessory protein [Candidatus Omnitrophota bacterium]